MVLIEPSGGADLSNDCIRAIRKVFDFCVIRLILDSIVQLLLIPRHLSA